MPAEPDNVQQANERPNILLFLCDQLTPRVMRLYGGPVPMTNVERLAAGGVAFRNAYASSVACSLRDALAAWHREPQYIPISKEKR